MIGREKCLSSYLKASSCDTTYNPINTNQPSDRGVFFFELFKRGTVDSDLTSDRHRRYANFSSEKTSCIRGQSTFAGGQGTESGARVYTHSRIPSTPICMHARAINVLCLHFFDSISPKEIHVSW